jgi:hypothetical protein
MFQHSLEEAGQRLVEQRRALKDAEAQFRSQYEAVKRSLETQFQRVHSQIEDNERKTRTGFDELKMTQLAGQPDQIQKLQREIDESMELARAEVAKHEAMSRSHLEEAERIIAGA